MCVRGEGGVGVKAKRTSSNLSFLMGPNEGATAEKDPLPPAAVGCIRHTFTRTHSGDFWKTDDGSSVCSGGQIFPRALLCVGVLLRPVRATPGREHRRSPVLCLS